MQNGNIGIFDSGLGGLSILKELLKVLPNENYLFFEDSINNPYGENLANLIEKDDRKAIRKLLIEKLGPYKNEMDSIVLGCTHYSLIKDEFFNLFNNVELLDGCKGVSKEVKNQLEKENLLNLSKEKGKITIENSKDEELIGRSYDFLER